MLPLASLGTAQEGRLRFSRAQVGVLDAVVGMQSDITCDETFVRAREELRRALDGVLDLERLLSRVERRVGRR